MPRCMQFPIFEGRGQKCSSRALQWPKPSLIADMFVAVPRGEDDTALKTKEESVDDQCLVSEAKVL